MTERIELGTGFLVTDRNSNSLLRVVKKPLEKARKISTIMFSKDAKGRPIPAKGSKMAAEKGKAKPCWERPALASLALERTSTPAIALRSRKA